MNAINQIVSLSVANRPILVGKLVNLSLNQLVDCMYSIVGYKYKYKLIDLIYLFYINFNIHRWYVQIFKFFNSLMHFRLCGYQIGTYFNNLKSVNWVVLVFKWRVISYHIQSNVWEMYSIDVIIFLSIIWSKTTQDTQFTIVVSPIFFNWK